MSNYIQAMEGQHNNGDEFIGYADVRRNAINGVFQYSALSDGEVNFQEWWNGEGLDFSFTSDNWKTEKKVSLHSDEILALCAAAVVSNFIDLDDIRDSVAVIESKVKKRKAQIKEFTDKYSSEYKPSDF